MTQGLTIGDPDDWDHLLAAREIPWKDLLKNLFSPWCTSLHWHGQSDRINEVLSRRVFLTVFLKSIDSIFQFRFLPYYFFSKALPFAGILTMLYFLLQEVTRSWRFTTAALIFYATVPAHYPHLLWITDPVIVVHFLILCGVWSYLQLIKHWNEKISAFLKYFLLMGFFGALAIKTKEPAVVFPLFAGGYTLWNWKTLTLKPLRFFLLLALFAWIIFLLVPVTNFKGWQSTGYGYHPETIVRMLFKNHDCGYESESASAFFSLARVWPVSIARTFGFGFLWFFVIALGGLLMKRKRSDAAPFFNHPLLFLSALWVLIDVAFMGCFQPDPRYFSGTMIPLTILSVRLMQYFYQSCPQKTRSLLAVLLVVVLSINTASNLRHVFYLRLQIGLRVNRFFDIAKIIYSDLKDPVFDLYDLASFYSASYSSFKPENRMENHTYYIPMGYEKWNRVKSPSMEEFGAAARLGLQYYAAPDNQWRPEEGPKVQRIGTVTGINPKSKLEKWVYALKSKQPSEIAVYKYTGKT